MNYDKLIEEDNLGEILGSNRFGVDTYANDALNSYLSTKIPQLLVYAIKPDFSSTHPDTHMCKLRSANAMQILTFPGTAAHNEFSADTRYLENALDLFFNSQTIGSLSSFNVSTLIGRSIYGNSSIIQDYIETHQNDIPTFDILIDNIKYIGCLSILNMLLDITPFILLPNDKIFHKIIDKMTNIEDYYEMMNMTYFIRSILCKGTWNGPSYVSPVLQFFNYLTTGQSIKMIISLLDINNIYLSMTIISFFIEIFDREKVGDFPNRETPCYGLPFIPRSEIAQYEMPDYIRTIAFSELSGPLNSFLKQIRLKLLDSSSKNEALDANHNYLINYVYILLEILYKHYYTSLTPFFPSFKHFFGLIPFVSMNSPVLTQLCFSLLSMIIIPDNQMLTDMIDTNSFVYFLPVEYKIVKTNHWIKPIKLKFLSNLIVNFHILKYDDFFKESIQDEQNEIIILLNEKIRAINIEEQLIDNMIIDIRTMIELS